ncbi:hypothetical protein [Priestia aryabhattai]
MIEKFYDVISNRPYQLVSLEVVDKEKRTSSYTIWAFLKNTQGFTISEANYNCYLTLVEKMMIDDAVIIEEKLKGNCLEAIDHLRRITHRALRIIMESKNEHFERRQHSFISQQWTQESIDSTANKLEFDCRIRLSL